MTYLPLSRLMVEGRPATTPVALRAGTPVDFAGFAAAVTHTAARLRSAGSRRAALVCRDSAWLAAALLGLLHAGVRAVMPANTRPGTLAALAGEVDVLVCDEPVDVGLPLLRLEPGDRAADPLPCIDPAAATIEFFTSGSTSAPKRIVKPLASLERECRTLQDMWGDALRGAPALATVSHQHIYSLTFKILWPLSAGRPFAAETHDLWEALLAELPPGAVIVTSPAHLTRLGGLAPLPESRRPRMVLSAGAPLPFVAAHEAAEVLGVLPTEIFGSTETGAIASRRQRVEDEPWRPLPGIEAARTDDGRLTIRSPFVPGDGRHESADLVDLAPDGGFRFRGRADRIVKIEGKRVSLPEVEAALTGLPLVEAAAVTVLGVRTARLAAAVVLSGEGRALLGELGGFRFGRLLRRRLALTLEPAGLPYRWRYVDALPGAAMGKRRDADIRALFEGAQG